MRQATNIPGVPLRRKAENMLAQGENMRTSIRARTHTHTRAHPATHSPNPTPPTHPATHAHAHTPVHANACSRVCKTHTRAGAEHCVDLVRNNMFLMIEGYMAERTSLHAYRCIKWCTHICVRTHPAAHTHTHSGSRDFAALSVDAAKGAVDAGTEGAYALLEYAALQAMASQGWEGDGGMRWRREPAVASEKLQLPPCEWIVLPGNCELHQSSRLHRSALACVRTCTSY